jgi:tungstate transport system substrate-binding protein
MRRALPVLAALVCAAASGCADQPARVRLGTTTSVHDSGLLDVLLPAYANTPGAEEVDVIAVGTGAAFKLGHDGQIDLLLVNDPRGEEQFIAAGDGLSRRTIMWNSFEILGPANDPAAIVKGAMTTPEALKLIAEARAAFVSRGDDSGTHRCEKRLWTKAGGRPEWPGYRETGTGMAATLRVADEVGGYVLTDRATRLTYKGTLRLVPLFGDRGDLQNEYSVVLLDPKRHPNLNHAGATRLAAWLASGEAGSRIAAFRLHGELLFHPLRGERPARRAG